MSSAEVMKVRLTAEGIQEVVASLKKVQAEVKTTAKEGKGATDALGALGTIFAARAMAGFVNEAIQAAAAIYDMTKKTGVAADQLSVFIAMGREAGLAQEQVGNGFKFLAKSLDGLKAGEDKATDAFARIGLSAKDLEGLSMDQAMLRIADAMARFSDGAGKAAVAQQLFGKSGNDLIPLLDDLAGEGFENARAELEKLGLVLSQDAVEAADKFADQVDRLKTSLEVGLAKSVGSALPVLTEAVELLNKAIASTPEGMKAGAVSFTLLGTAATGAAVAVKALGSAFAGLGPIGLAVVAITAAVSALVALKAAHEAAQAAAVQENAALHERVTKGEKLVEAYQREAQALAKGGLGAKEQRDHEEKLKKIREDLLKLSPAYKEALDRETGGLLDQAAALKRVAEEQSRVREEKLRMAKAEVANLEWQIKNLEIQSKQMSEEAKYQKMAFGVSGVDSGTGGYESQLRKRLEEQKALLDALNGGGPNTGSGAGESRPTVPVVTDTKPTKDANKEALAAIKRLQASQKQLLDEGNALNERSYDAGLRSLEKYQETRRQLLELGNQQELEALEAQLNAEVALGKQASETKILDLQNEIAIRKRVNDESLREDAAKAEKERKQAEQDARQRFEQSIGTSRQQADADLSNAMTATDQAQSFGVMGDDAAIAKRIQAYKDWVAAMEQTYAALARYAEQNPENGSLAAEAEALKIQIDGVKMSLAEMENQWQRVQDAGAQALASGMVEALTSIGDGTKSVSDAFGDMARSVLASIQQVLVKLMLMKAAEAMFGGSSAGSMGASILKAFSFAGGGEVHGPGTATSDSVLARLSNGEFVNRAAAVAFYGPDFFHALNGLRIPKSALPGYADGGLVGGGAQPQTMRTELDGALRIDLGEGLENAVLRVMKSPQGVRIQAGNAAANPKRFNRALGRG